MQSDIGKQFKISYEVSSWPTNLTPRCFSKENEKSCSHKNTPKNIHSNFIHNCHKQETSCDFCFSFLGRLDNPLGVRMQWASDSSLYLRYFLLMHLLRV